MFDCVAQRGKSRMYPYNTAQESSHSQPEFLHASNPLLLALRCCRTVLRGRCKTRFLFDGKTLKGWEGDTEETWKVEDGVITAGSLDTTVPRTKFLCTTRPTRTSS